MTNEYETKWFTLLEKLLSLSKEGRLDWSLGQWNESIFETSAGQNLIQIEKKVASFDGEIIIHLRVLDQSENVKEYFSDEDFSLEKPKAYKIMNELWSSARRSASNADEVLDDLISNLNKIP